MAPSLHTFTTDTSFLALDGDALKLREQRFRYQHRLRLIQAQSRLPATASRVLTALPLLLHFNHPALPGYAGHQSPAGIHRFSTSPAAIKHIQHFAPGFAPPSSAFEARQPQIDAVYFMGSVGSVAQTRASDIDIWVCLPAQHHAHMEQKLSVISRWAKGLGVDLQCFCVDASISTPRDKPFWRLLLDEFYRTGCWLAGKIPLWWLMPNIPDEQHTAWATAVQEFMPLNSTIDFGPVAEFTSLELYAATIEELARAIHNPYKALLKIALLESYANGMPSLSAHYKSEVLQRANAPLVDSYVLLAEQLEQFFSRFSIPLRRDFMRRAWLTKTTRANARLGLNGAWWAFAQRWGYSRQQVEHLRWPAQWSLAELVDENHRVIAAFAHALSFATSLKPPASGRLRSVAWATACKIASGTVI